MPSRLMVLAIFLFWIASMSKPITAAAIGILADAGKLSFDDPVERYLPEFHEVEVAGSAAATTGAAGRA